jgi:hypothetical protein
MALVSCESAGWYWRFFAILTKRRLKRGVFKGSLDHDHIA